MSKTIPLIVANFETSLVNALTTGTTFDLVSNIDDDGNTLTDGLYGFTINEGQANEEHLFGTLVSSTVTITLRNVQRNDSVTAQTGLSHRKGDSVKITNFPVLMRIQRILLGVTGIDSTNPLFYDTDFVPTSAAQIATKKYVDNTATGTTIYDQSILGSICGEDVVEGEYVYLKEADGKWWKTDASVSATSENVVVGITQGVGTADGLISGGVLVAGLDKTQTYTAGSKYYLSDTAGDVSTSKGTIEVFVGTGDINNNLVFQHLSNIETLTADEKDALIGNSGITPDTDNKFIDNADTTIAAVKTATTISFADSNPDTILDSGNGFITAGFKVGDSITISGSASNDGTYTIKTVTAGTITLITTDTLVVEAVGATVTITAATASKVLRLKSDSKLPILDASNLTGNPSLDASNMTGDPALDGSNITNVIILYKLAASDTLQSSADTERTSASIPSGSEEFMEKRITVRYSGGVRVTFESSSAQVSAGYELRNEHGGVLGSTTQGSTGYQSKSIDIYVVAGTNIKLYFLSNTSNTQASIKNFRVKFTKSETTDSEVITD